MDSIRTVLRGHNDSPESRQLTLVVPVAGNETDNRLLQLVERIARKRQARITLIYVVEVDQALPLEAELPGDVQHGETVLQASRDTLAKSPDAKTFSVTTDLLQARSAGAAIVDESINQEADCILMSARLMKRHGKLTCGETVDYVMKNALCEVMVIRQQMPEAILEELEYEFE